MPVLLVVSLGLAACTPAPVVSTINDPFERENRAIHKINKAMDKAVIKPLSGAYGAITRGAISTGVSNFSSNLSLPRIVANDLLQLNLKDAVANTFRFALNSTVGIGGIFDIATQNGLDQRNTDFGETLYVWGIPEGAYVELPFLGPSTQRATVGTVVDFIFDPLNRVVRPPKRYIGTAAHLLNKLGDRNKYSIMVDSILYGSVDSYAQARLLYLQSRRMELSGKLNEADLEDPYAQ